MIEPIETEKDGKANRNPTIAKLVTNPGLESANLTDADVEEGRGGLLATEKKSRPPAC
jgi:hypothetical protein